MRTSKKSVIAVLTAAMCLGMSACSVSFGFVDDSSSSETDSSRTDNSKISSLINKDFSSQDNGEVYYLDGDFSEAEFSVAAAKTQDEWSALSDDDKYAAALSFLNFWMYYGDDASIRFRPSELVTGIGETFSEENTTVGSAAIKFAVPDNVEKYTELIENMKSSD